MQTFHKGAECGCKYKTETRVENTVSRGILRSRESIRMKNTSSFMPRRESRGALGLIFRGFVPSRGKRRIVRRPIPDDN